MQTTEELPIELECWLIRHGIMEPTRAPGFVSHGAAAQPKQESEHAKAVSTGIGMGWKPEFAGQEPPF